VARIRSVHPDICTDETLAGVTAHAERTFVRLWTHCDDEGRCVDNAKLIKAALYPLHDEMTAAQVDHDLNELASKGLIWRYQSDGKSLISAKPSAWRHWQKPKHPQPSKLPAPPDDYTPPPEPTGHVPEQDGASRNVAEQSGTERNGTDRVGDDRPGSLRGVVDGVGVVVGVGVRAPERSGTLAIVPANGSSPPVTGSEPRRFLDYAPDFEAWWQLYPRKIAKREAQKAYRTALGHADQRTLTDGLTRSIEAWQSERRALDKIPHAASWLTGRRWEDDLTATSQPRPEPKGFAGIRAALEERGSA
jgi:hypothetical protein